MIRKEVQVSRTVLDELRRILVDSEVSYGAASLLLLSKEIQTGDVVQVTREDDNEWPAPDRVGRQELEVVLGNEHISFYTTKLGSLMQVQQSKDPDGLRVFYYLVQVWLAYASKLCHAYLALMTQHVFCILLQDLKCMVFSLISAHFKIQPIQK